ncbi:MAG: SDR family NAD(P)-dependent oxidoreductase [Nitrososphaerales archaeon]
MGTRNDELKNLFSLEGKTALVIGASGTLGSAISQGLAAYGADVALVGRNRVKLRAASMIVEKCNRKSITIEADVTVPAEVEALVSQTLKEFEGIDILVNAQGINIRKPSDVITIDEWEQVMNANLKSVFLSCQAVGTVMIKQQSGKIVNISSIAGRLGYEKGYSAYSPSKAGVDALTRVLASEWGKHNITVNAIAPYFIRSQLTEKVLSDKSFYDWVMTGLPMKTVGSPIDVVGAALLLASPASNWINGQVICIDGGRSVT